MKTTTRTTSLAAASAMLALAVGGGALASASGTGGPGGELRACAHDQTGNLRLVADESECRRKERFVAWHVSGPPGEQGPAGSAGETGAAGPDGLSGPQGETGTAGQQGETGTAGQQGSAGDDGAQGGPGPAGETGPVGEAGPAGEAGTIGSTGPTGPAGPSSALEATRGFGPVNFEAFQASLTVVTLRNAPAGDYAVSAKTTIRDAASSSFAATSCQLRVGALVIDQSRVAIPAGASAAPVPVQGTASMSAPASFSLVCSIPGGGAFTSDSKLSAIRVDRVTSVADPGA